MATVEPNSSNQFVTDLINLQSDFRSELPQGDLREKVKALVPVHRILADLDRSLIPSEIASSARGRLLHYFLSYLLTLCTVCHDHWHAHADKNKNFDFESWLIDAG